MNKAIRYDSRELLKSDQRIDPNRIKLARESRGLTQADLAQLIPRNQRHDDGRENDDQSSVTTQLVSRWELGLTSAYSRIEDIAKALNYPKSYFRQQLISMPNILQQLYRTKSAMSTKDKKQVEASCYIRVDQFSAIIDKWADIDWNVPVFSTDDGTPEQIANTVRLQLNLQRGPIQNLMKVVESLGVPVFVEPFIDSTFDGLTIQKPGIPPVIFLNSNRPGERMRFTLAHELGHLVMHRVPNPSLEILETEANQFASAFLMPSEDIFSHLSKVDLFSICELKLHWKTSIQSLIYRARSLGRISDEKSRRLFIEVSKNGWKKNEPYPISPEEPGLVKSIISNIKDQVRITDEDIAFFVGSTEQEFRESFLGNKSKLKLLKISSAI